MYFFNTGWWKKKSATGEYFASTRLNYSYKTKMVLGFKSSIFIQIEQKERQYAPLKYLMSLCYMQVTLWVIEDKN